MELRTISKDAENIPYNLVSKACDDSKTVDGQLPRKNALCARPVLGNLTNKVDRDVRWISSQSHAENLGELNLALRFSLCALIV
ncbi:hypothetical protein P879_10963 [Paragonimus westermani]|uniref:Uncharacterized protein n=1 Tax=Paragonimus westermani TaxID=34504 RepID=A0A8T0CYN4_9TREM|nr:hypothetical protein P879_10963 [Paragonimus westermani]